MGILVSVIIAVAAFLIVIVVLRVLRSGPAAKDARDPRSRPGARGTSSKESNSAPDQISLMPEAEPVSGDVAARLEALQTLGFESVGRFGVREIEGLRIVALTHPRDPAVAIIYERPGQGCHTDCVAYFDPVGSITVTNAPEAGVLDDRPGHRKVYLSDVGEAVIFRRLQGEVTHKKRRFVAPQMFRKLFEKQYADEMEWQRSGTGSTLEELKQVAASSDGSFSKEEIEEARRVLAGQT